MQAPGPRSVWRYHFSGSSEQNFSLNCHSLKIGSYDLFSPLCSECHRDFSIRIQRGLDPPDWQSESDSSLARRDLRSSFPQQLTIPPEYRGIANTATSITAQTFPLTTGQESG